MNFKVNIHAARSCTVNLAQEYVNNSDQSKEISFHYPVDLNYAISKIHVQFSTLSEKKTIANIVTEMKPREEAKATYEQSVKDGRETAVLAKHAFTDSRQLMKI